MKRSMPLPAGMQRAVNQGRGVYIWMSKHGDYVWQYNCARICEAEREVANINKNQRRKGGSANVGH